MFHEYGQVSKVRLDMTNTRCLCKRTVQQNQSFWCCLFTKQPSLRRRICDWYSDMCKRTFMSKTGDGTSDVTVNGGESMWGCWLQRRLSSRPSPMDKLCFPNCLAAEQIDKATWVESEKVIGCYFVSTWPTTGSAPGGSWSHCPKCGGWIDACDTFCRAACCAVPKSIYSDATTTARWWYPATPQKMLLRSWLWQVCWRMCRIHWRALPTSKVRSCDDRWELWTTKRRGEENPTSWT